MNNYIFHCISATLFSKMPLMKNRIASSVSVLVPIVAATIAAFPLNSSAGVEDTVWNAQRERAKELKKVNAKRLRDAGEKGDVAYFAVPAMSEVMRLDDTWPEDGELNGTVRCVLAKGEFESCSFQLFSFRDFDDVELKVDLPGLKNDIRVVKLWFQNGNGWVSYFDDTGLKLTPELLLHDENLIKVVKDKEPANYARVRKDGKDKYHWISAPKKADSYNSGFNQYDKGFYDADKLLPVSLEKDSFKQFFITVNADKNQKSGIYKGKVTVTRKGKTLATVPLSVRVLPFELPMPKGYLEPEKPYLHSCMGAMPNLGRLTAALGDAEKAKTYYLGRLKSLYEHSVFHAPYIYEGDFERQKWIVDSLRKIGFPLDVVICNPRVPWFALNFGGRMSWRNYYDSVVSARECKEYYDKLLPGSTILCAHGDEQGTAFVTAHRELFREYEKQGIHMGCAGHNALLYKGGYAYSFMPLGTSPDAMIDKTRPWREIGNTWLGFYAAQHTASENPQFVRRQHGLLGWLNGATMSYNYEFAIGSFNDRANVLYRPMVISYADSKGLMETIQYAGFREACDDIRYATYLRQLADESIAKGDVDARLLAKKARMYLAMLNRDSVDLNLARLEMIEYILKMREALGK